MATEPQITSIDDMKAALDARIGEARSMSEFYRREVAKNEASASRYDGIAYELSTIRRRLDPVKLEIVAAASEAA